MIEMGYILSMKYDTSRCWQYGPGKQIQHDMRTYTGPSDHTEDFGAHFFTTFPISSTIKARMARQKIAKLTDIIQ